MPKYEPRYKEHQVITGTGPVVVITGWTVRAAIAKRIPVDQYAAIGNLYSPTRGLTPLIRNLILNPHIRLLALFDATREDRNSGSVQCLRDFFLHGVTAGKTLLGKDCWVVNSPIEGYVDNVIPLEILDKLRAAIAVKSVSTTVASLVEVVNEMNQSYDPMNLKPWGEPIDFPVEEILPTIYPGPNYGHRIEGKTIAETWVKLLHRIKSTGTIRPTGYDGRWQELIDLVAIVTDEPEDFYFPEPNYLSHDRDFLVKYIPQILDDAPHAPGVKYTYGQRLRSGFEERDQIEQVILKLTGEIDAASGVMSLWDVKDHEKGGSPCLNHIWVRVVDNELSLTATFRSNDMFGAWPSNAMGLRALQRHIRDEIAKRSEYDLVMGPLITISQSAHIYDDCWDDVDALVRDHYIKKSSYNDPSGSFIVSIDANLKQISVEWITPDSGESVNLYQGKNAQSVYRAIAADCPYLQADHALYLGTELHKAEMAIALNMEYTQDAKLIHGVW